MTNILEFIRKFLKQVGIFLFITVLFLSLSQVKEVKAKENENNELEVTFIANEGGQILDKGATKRMIHKKVLIGTDVENIFPKVIPAPGYKFNKWEYPNSSKELDKIQEVKLEYHATFFPDLNDNDTDDRLEEIKVSFNTNSSIQVPEKKIHVGEKIIFPDISKEGYILVGWYEDSEFTKNFDFNKPVLKSTKLYARWEKMEDLISINEGVVTIRDQDISNSLEKMLNEKNEKNDKEELKKMEEFNQEAMDEGNEFSQISYLFDNFNMMNNYIMKFVDSNQNFVLSLILPYGKTVKLFNENNKIIEEYSIRQNTTIKLTNFNQESTYMNVSNRTINQINFVELHTFMKQKNELETKERVWNEPEEETIKKRDHKLILTYTLWASCGLAFAYLFYLFFRILKRKKKPKMEGAIKN